MSIVIVVVLAILFQQLIAPRYVSLTYTEFIRYVEERKINRIYVDGYNWRGELIVNGAVQNYYATVGPSLYDSEALRAMQTAWNELGLNVNISLADPNAGSIWSSVFTLVGIVLVAVVF